VYILCNRQGFGWEAAFLVALIPTSVGILGPAFLVPIASALMFVPLSLFLVLNFRGFGSYLILFVFMLFLVSGHGPSAICLGIILLPAILIILRRDWKHALGITIAVAVPFLLILPFAFNLASDLVRSLFAFQGGISYHDFPYLVSELGPVWIALAFVGTLYLLIRGDRNSSVIVLGLLGLAVMLVAFNVFHVGIGILYLRGLLFMVLMLGIVAGAGLMALRKIRLPDKALNLRLAPAVRYLGPGLALVLVISVLATTLPLRFDAPYYHMIDAGDYKAFVWIKDNAEQSQQKAILDPWKATAFTATTGIPVHTRIHIRPLPEDYETYQFLNEGCLDTQFLEDNSISIVYSVSACENPRLNLVRENVYLVMEPENQ
jgi:hypothetical protein